MNGEKPRLLSKRLMTSAIIVSIAVYVIFFAPLWLFIITNMLIIGLALLEFYSICENIDFKPNKIIGVALGSLLPMFIFVPGDALIFIVAIVILSFKNFETQDRYRGIVNTGITIFGMVYIALLCSFFTKMRYLEDGAIWVAYLITMIKVGDAGAYFIGTTYGTRKLVERISPNKSVEGAIGGFICSILSSLCFKIFLPHIPFVHLFVLGIVLSIIGQMGDLVESLIKRECNVKDSGIMPGLGGILDIFDSMIFSVPFLYYYINVFLMR